MRLKRKIKNVNIIRMLVKLITVKVILIIIIVVLVHIKVKVHKTRMKVVIKYAIRREELIHQNTKNMKKNEIYKSDVTVNK